MEERIKALQDLKDFVRDNQACLRDYLGIEDDDGDNQLGPDEDAGDLGAADAGNRLREEGERVIDKAQEAENALEAQIAEKAKAE